MTDLRLPKGYLTNPTASSDSKGSPYWDEPPSDRRLLFQAPVYRIARRLARDLTPETIVDIGCGVAHKLVKYLGDEASRVIGVDQESALEYARDRFPDGDWVSADLEDPLCFKPVYSLQPEIVVCADVVEHLADPVPLLCALRRMVANGAFVVLSTPDRSKLEEARPLGPPNNPRHVREWAPGEFRHLLEDHGVPTWRLLHRLPRDYRLSGAEVRRMIWRLLHLKAIPDRRSCMIFILASPPRGTSDA